MSSGFSDRLVFPESPLVPPLDNRVFQRVVDNVKNPNTLPHTDIAMALGYEGLDYIGKLFDNLHNLYIRFGTEETDLQIFRFGYNTPLSLLIAQDYLRYFPPEKVIKTISPQVDDQPVFRLYNKYLMSCFGFLQTFRPTSVQEALIIFFYCGRERPFVSDSEYYFAGVDAAAINFTRCAQYFELL